MHYACGALCFCLKLSAPELQDAAVLQRTHFTEGLSLISGHQSKSGMGLLLNHLSVAAVLRFIIKPW